MESREGTAITTCREVGMTTSPGVRYELGVDDFVLLTDLQSLLGRVLIQERIGSQKKILIIVWRVISSLC